MSKSPSELICLYSAVIIVVWYLIHFFTSLVPKEVVQKQICSEAHFSVTHFPQLDNHLAFPERLWAITKKLMPVQSAHCAAAPVRVVLHSAFPSKSREPGPKITDWNLCSGSWIYSLGGLRGIYKGPRVLGLQQPEEIMLFTQAWRLWWGLS